MAYTARNVLLTPALQESTYHTIPGAEDPVTSRKPWAETYDGIAQQHIRPFLNPNQDDINAFFGNEDALDVYLLSTLASAMNPLRERFQTEGDTVRAFYTQLCPCVHFPLQRISDLYAESGPLGPTNVSQTVDVQWGIGTTTLLIGELKRHGIISPSRWSGAHNPNTNRTRLGKEMRGYCHKYGCAAGMVFDGKYLMILIFMAANQDEVRSAQCDVACFIFPRTSPVLRYGLYRAISLQIRRYQAERAQPHLRLGNYIRRFDWWSGCPYWTDAAGRRYDEHPGGYYRIWHAGNGSWYWVQADGNPVVVNGDYLWDTPGLW